MIELNEKFEARADELLKEYANFMEKLEAKPVDITKLDAEKNKLREALKLVEDPASVELKVRVSYRIGRLAKNEGITKHQSSRGRDINDVLEHGITLPDDICLLNIKVTPVLNRGTKLRFCEDYSLYDVNRIMLENSVCGERPEVVTELNNLLTKTAIRAMIKKAYIEKPGDIYTTKDNVANDLIRFIHVNFVVSSIEKDGEEVPAYIMTK